MESNMKTARNILAAAVLATGVSAAAIAYAQTPIGQLNTVQGITISGTVAEVFGNKFVIEDASGRILVESGPEWYRKIDVTRGEKISVIGRPDGGSFDAFTIIRADGSRIEVRPPNGPAPWSGGRRAAGDTEMRPQALAPNTYRGPSMQWKGKKGYGPAHVSPSEELPYRDLVAILEKNGYTNIHDADRKKRHYEFDATNRHGERVEVHVDFAGNVYKEERDD
jgi:hypothetical protein